MASDKVPLIPHMPWSCPAGHRWGPGRVLFGWQPCGTCASERSSFGHQTIRCDAGGCRLRYYYPPHEGQEWIEA